MLENDRYGFYEVVPDGVRSARRGTRQARPLRHSAKTGCQHRAATLRVLEETRVEAISGPDARRSAAPSHRCSEARKNRC